MFSLNNVFYLYFFFTLIPLSAQEEDSEIIIISGHIGKEIQASKIDIKQTQNTKSSEEYNYSNPGISIYYELFGKLFGSVNVDYRINKTNALSLGISPAEDAIIPSIMYYKFNGEKYRRETGIGLGPLLTQTEGCRGIVIFGVIGYRYQQKKGLLFRIGFTPFIMIGFNGKFLPLPWAGISIGYSF